MPAGSARSGRRSGESALAREIAACRLCPRLVEWRERIAREKVKRHREEEYWGAPVPSFGPIDAALLVIGLAPAAHGANRTGRMFTGDRSGEWLYRALHLHGFASRGVSVSRDDGLVLRDCRITAVAHCAPPGNKLAPEEIRACSGYLAREIALMRRLRLIVALGGTAFARALTHAGARPARFAHGAEVPLPGGRILLASYHPSQQSTFTGRLTEEMFHRIFRRARTILQSKERTP